MLFLTLMGLVPHRGIVRVSVTATIAVALCGVAIAQDEDRFYHDTTSPTVLERKTVEDALRESSLQMDRSAAKTLSSGMPAPIVHWLLKSDPPDVDGVIDCMAISSAVYSDSTSGDSLVLCGCSYLWNGTYVMILRREAGLWSAIWDTTTPNGLTLPAVSTMEFGGAAPWGETYSVSGMDFPSAGHYLIGWNGRTGRVLGYLWGPTPILVDVDGDGLMEVSTLEGGVKRRPVIERVYVYNMETRVFEYSPELKTDRLDQDQRE